MDWLTLGAFCAALILCIVFNISILWALAFGLLIFMLYGRRRGFAWKELLGIAFEGVVTVRKLLVTFMLIGMLTGLWRAAGTIPVIVCYVSGLIRPSVFLLMTFLLNCGVSMLTGTAFGTAATMGVICATMGITMGVEPVMIGGAVLSGIFFGDRSSPVSTSALLVSDLTHTDIFDNIRRMIRMAAVPFAVTCLIYFVLGMSQSGAEAAIDLRALFGREFALHWAALIPAIVILVLSVLRVRVQLAMSASILSAVPICIFLQSVSPAQLFTVLITGYHAADTEVAAMINGGGIVSMLRVAGIVCLSSSYSGLFRKTGLLDRAKGAVDALASKTSSFAALLITSIASSMIACNQTLAVMLSHQLCCDLTEYAEAADPEHSAAEAGASHASAGLEHGLVKAGAAHASVGLEHSVAKTGASHMSAGLEHGLVKDGAAHVSSVQRPSRASDFALALEDSAIVVSPLIPWSIASAVPLSSIGAPTGSILLACYLFLLPLWHLALSLRRKPPEPRA